MRASSAFQYGEKVSHERSVERNHHSLVVFLDQGAPKLLYFSTSDLAVMWSYCHTHRVSQPLGVSSEFDCTIAEVDTDQAKLLFVNASDA